MTKACTACGKVLPLDENNFYKKNKGRHWHASCKHCMNDKAKKSYSYGKEKSFLPQHEKMSITLPIEYQEKIDNCFFIDPEQTKRFIEALYKRIGHPKQEVA